MHFIGYKMSTICNNLARFVILAFRAIYLVL